MRRAIQNMKVSIQPDRSRGSTKTALTIEPGSDDVWAYMEMDAERITIIIEPGSSVEVQDKRI